MDSERLRTLLKAVSSGQVDPEDAAAALIAGPLGGDGSGFADLGYARVDTHRGIRTGDPEVVYGAGKTAAETVGIVETLRRASGVGTPTLVTRAGAATVAALRERWPDARVSSSASASASASGDERPATVVVGPLPEPRGRVVIVAAGTSDAPVAEEAAMTAEAAGAGVEMVRDVGVAGLHRVLAARPVLDSADCLVVIAGMEGALPSVIGGLVGVPLVAVPTSVGYGASFGGLAALLGMLTSCAPGIAVCNIDNGFGAGLFAARVARRA
ncbi:MULTISPECIES: nickel pincer cofactor biosynthesis protein LarB [unclassified Parafrankia]|uniref:nickel pincer cofactor biosynthesis protein LarB n=1 Tax=unclassified Parafrankia TaxID=2994368 RepID=UPI000DA59A32|nr:MULTISPECIES: nickel pincer cofactor biosynthesis protein LarB [unclassified Parafrankia]TCJ35282.1 nickel pincer cofactor biosynthesis protein LarB [Parafrankia sp. BMG5.11]SQD95175.1 Circadian phase modifier CpmA [Parafrankia sp. Ea1.12]